MVKKEQIVSVGELIEKNKLENLTPHIDADNILIQIPDVNRPALQLTGFFDHFDDERVQMLGNVECEYINTLSMERRREVYDQLLGYKFPCIIYAADKYPDEIMLECCNQHGIPCLHSNRSTSELMGEIIRWLKVKLAKMITVHGVLVDIFGEGVMITGDSGVGKSEAAIELIKRGHRLVADDVVEIRKVSNDTLIGNAPDKTRYFLELRGIGIIDIRTLFGVESVKDTQQIDMIIQLEDFNVNKEYDRTGLEEKYIDYLGNHIICHELPIKPGRNLAIICEAAAINHKAKKMGYNGARVFLDKLGIKQSKDTE